jgi:hypothetical protein
VPSLLAENLTIRSHYGVYHPNFDNHLYRNVTILDAHTEPFNRGHDDRSVQDGVLAVDGLVFDGCSAGRMPLIQISDDNASGRAVSHFRGVETLDWRENRQRSIVNLGGGPRPQPKTARGVPIYLHDWYGAGRTALVVSERSPEYKSDPAMYREDRPLTGDASRVCEVSGIAFPAVLTPVDDLPPATVITQIEPMTGGRIAVRGIVSDNGAVREVRVQGQPAQLDSLTGDWHIELTGLSDNEPIEAKSTDLAGNRERLPHIVTWAPAAAAE